MKAKEGEIISLVSFSRQAGIPLLYQVLYISCQFWTIVMLCGHPLMLTRLNILKDFIPSIFLHVSILRYSLTK